MKLMIRRDAKFVLKDHFKINQGKIIVNYALKGIIKINLAKTVIKNARKELFQIQKEPVIAYNVQKDHSLHPKVPLNVNSAIKANIKIIEDNKAVFYAILEHIIIMLAKQHVFNVLQMDIQINSVQKNVNFAKTVNM